MRSSSLEKSELKKDQRGVSVVETTLILSFVGIMAIVGLTGVGEGAGKTFEIVKDKMLAGGFVNPPKPPCPGC